MKIIDTKYIVYCLVFFGVSFVLLFVDLIDIMYTTADDLSISQTTYSDYIDIGFGQGRIGFLILGFLIQFPYMFGSFGIVKLLHLIAIVLAVGSIGYLLAYVFKNRYIGLTYSFLVVFLWQNGSHNLLTSYYFYIPFGIFLFTMSLILFLKYLENNTKKYLYASLLFWLIVVFAGTDFWILYLPVFFFVAYFSIIDTHFVFKIKSAIIKSFWHILIGVACVALYFGFIVYSGGTYGGRAVELDVIRMVQTAFVYAIGLLPGVQFFYDFASYDLGYIFQLIGYKSVFMAILLIYLLLTFKNEMQASYNKISISLYILVCLYLIIAPIFMISWTIKYQEWALEREVHDYLYSSFSYLGWMMLLLLILVKTRINWIYYIFVSIFGMLFILVQIHNTNLEQKQARYSEKMFLLNALLTTSQPLEQSLCIEAPTLWDDGVAVREAKLNYWEAFADVWTAYAKNKFNRSVKIIENGNCSAKIDYFRSEHKDASYMVYSEHNLTKMVLTLKNKCNKNRPCYSLEKNKLMGNVNLAFDSFVYGDDSFLITKFAEPSESTKKINIYNINKELPSESIISIIDYKIDEIYTPMIQFGKNFYPKETDGVSTWKWASDSGEISINSATKKNVTIEIDIQVAQSSKISLQTSTLKQDFDISNSEKNTIRFNMTLDKDINTIKILTNKKPIKLSKSDERLFAFRIFSIKIKENSLDRL